MALIRWEPCRPMLPFMGFDLLKRRMDRLFDENSLGSEAEGSRTDWIPSVDLSEDGDKFTLLAEMPGLEKKDIKLTVEGNVLTVSGEKKLERERKDRSFYLLERANGNFFRSFTLPTRVDNERIQAEFKNGVLVIEVPKVAEAKAKEIEIQLK